MGFAMEKIPRKRRRGKFRQALARSRVWNLGEWNTELTADPTLAEMVLAVLYAPDESGRAARLEALASERLFVSLPRAVPAVRAVLAELRRTPQGRLVYREAYPRFCLWAVRLAWADVEAEQGVADAARAAHFHARTMRYMVKFVLSLKGAPSSTDALAQLGSPSAEEAARLDELLDAAASGPVRGGELELVETVANMLQFTPPRDRDRALTEVFVEKLIKNDADAVAKLAIKSLGDRWRAEQAAMLARQATMLGCTRSALRMRNLRRKRTKKRDAARKDAHRVKSQT
jgi:hypothetical protein